MKILYINHYAGSPIYGMEYRPYYMAREWALYGHTVRIVASSFSHIRSKQPKMTGQRWIEENIDGITYEWMAGTTYEGNGIRRTWSMVVFLWKLYLESRRLAESFRPDVVIASSTYPMDIWPARRIAQITGARLVYEVHDLWPLTPIELGGMSRLHPFVLWAQAAENYAYKHADLVVSLLPYVHQHMVAHGLDLKKLAIVPNGINPDEWNKKEKTLPGKIEQRLDEIRSRHTAIVGYAGTHGIANALDRMLACAEILRSQGIAFVLVGSGPEKQKLVTESQKRGLGNVYFFDPIPKNNIPQLLEWFDIAFLSWNRQPLYRFGTSPNKLFDYMMAARPVVQCIDAPPGPVENAGCGVSISSSDSREAADAIKRLLQLPEDERFQIGERGRTYVLKNHTYPVLAKLFLESISKATS